MLTLLLSAVLMHPVHETVSEIEWNDKTHRLEVAVRLSALDEQWIGKTYAIDNERPEWALSYLKSTFRIDPERDRPKSPDKDPDSKDPDSKDPDSKDLDSKDLGSKSKRPEPTHTYHWIGRGEEGSHVWWYFEIAPKNGARPKLLEARMMFERNDNFVNRILILDRVPRVAATLTIQRPTLELDKVADEQQELKADSRNRLDR